MNLLKYIRSNFLFILSLIFLALIAFNPEVKGYVMSGLLKTGLFDADVRNSDPKATGVVPSVQFTDADGRVIDLARLKGKVLFLNFWATWCPPCRAEMSSINNLYNKFKGNDSIVFIMVDADNNLKRSAAFMKRKNYNLPVYVPVSAIPEQLFKGSLPTTIIINKRGEVVLYHEGMANYNSPEIGKFLLSLSGK